MVKQGYSIQARIQGQLKVLLQNLPFIIFLFAGVMAKAQFIPDRWRYEITLHEKLERLHEIPVGPYVRLNGGEILAASDTVVLVSRDNGKQWDAYPTFEDNKKFRMGARAVLRTRSGVVIIAFYNLAERHWTWDDKLKDAPGARLPTYVIRSTDDGRTWEKPQMLHAEWSGSVRDIIETKDGYVVFTTMIMLHNPGRHAVLTYMSKDQGKTWNRSNIIDLGGIGHHDGAMEATLTELKDGTLMKLIRTNWGQFWRAESWDKGMSWHLIGPSGIPASTAPANMKRLQSGRLMIAWNRPYPEGKSEFRMTGGDRSSRAVASSNHRAELSIAFSEDDGTTWSDPVIVARSKEGREVSYPFIFEVSPGEIWITTFRGPLRAKFQEKDFIR